MSVMKHPSILGLGFERQLGDPTPEDMVVIILCVTKLRGGCGCCEHMLVVLVLLQNLLLLNHYLLLL